MARDGLLRAGVLRCGCVLFFSLQFWMSRVSTFKNVRFRRQ
jgi:hypothetical protein